MTEGYTKVTHIRYYMVLDKWFNVISLCEIQQTKPTFLKCSITEGFNCYAE
jgi:hypothetical protein